LPTYGSWHHLSFASKIKIVLISAKLFICRNWVMAPKKDNGDPDDEPSGLFNARNRGLSYYNKTGELTTVADVTLGVLGK
jgi:hypothetical protein